MKQLLRLAVLASAFFGFSLAAEDYKEGVHYERLSQPVPSTAPAGKVEVVEFFWYSCPHCYRLEKFMISWKKRNAAKVQFSMQPTILRDPFAPMARMYYTLQALGKQEALHSVVYQSIHEDGLSLSDQGVALDWAAAQGLSRAQFATQYNSKATTAKVEQAIARTRLYTVEETPTIVVGGRYKTTSRHTNGDYEGVLKVVDFLVAKVAAETK